MHRRWFWTIVGVLAAFPAHAASTLGGPTLLGIPVDFVLFALTLLGVALLHRHTLWVAVSGLVAISLYKIGFTGFNEGAGVSGWLAHMHHEWVVLTNLLGLLLGFAVLARQFEDSGVPQVLPRFLPDDWKGAFVLLAMVFVLSAFLDNIAAALIGGTVAASVFKRRVHIGYLAAIVAASNAGGSGSVVGDTTTTMMWIDGVSPLDVTHAYVAAAVALVIFGLVAARQQQAYQPIQKDAGANARVDWTRVGIVVWILAAAIATNVFVNTQYPQVSDAFPFLGAAVWLAIVLAAPVRKPEWSLLPEALQGSVFLLALVTCASMMPVEELPAASWQSAFGLGFVSAVFDNIPLTALALTQGGYDWGVLAYAVGFGGSMIWFGSTAGVALSNQNPQPKTVGAWLKGGWHIAVAYSAGFFVMLAVVGWQPHPPHKAAQAYPPGGAAQIMDR
ncbi:MAG: citrate transporter [Gammaproteobacteria bacterium]|nr:citrate transporter [Gammaproteobacteria bacterium]